MPEKSSWESAAEHGLIEAANSVGAALRLLSSGDPMNAAISAASAQGSLAQATMGLVRAVEEAKP